MIQHLSVALPPFTDIRLAIKSQRRSWQGRSIPKPQQLLATLNKFTASQREARTARAARTRCPSSPGVSLQGLIKLLFKIISLSI